MLTKCHQKSTMVLPLGFWPQYHVFLDIHSIDGDSEAFFEGLWSTVVL